MPSPSEAPSGGAKPFWLLFWRLKKVTCRKGGTLSSRYRSNGYVPGQQSPGRLQGRLASKLPPQGTLSAVKTSLSRLNDVQRPIRQQLTELDHLLDTEGEMPIRTFQVEGQVSVG
jgi:hypothetical protein